MSHVRNFGQRRDGGRKETRSKLSFPGGLDVHDRTPKPLVRYEVSDEGLSRSKTVALTFDDGPSEYTDQILDILKQHKAKASFFVLGDHVERHYLERMVELGCEVCNHTTSHPNLENLNPREVLHEFATCSTRIITATGQSPYFYRAPFGKDTPDARVAGLACGMVSVLWDVQAEDWVLTDAASIYSRVLTGVLDGGQVVLLHDGAPDGRPNDRQPTVNAVKDLVPDLIDRGYELVTVSELYGRVACSEDAAISAS